MPDDESATNARTPARPLGPGRLGGLWAVLERDFVVTTSKSAFLWQRLIVVLIAAIVATAVILSNRAAQPDTVGRYLLGSVAFVCPFLVFLLAPAGASPSISSEREGGTLDLVRAAPGNALTFVLAKALSRLFALLTLVLGLLPVMGIAFVYGGVGLREFLEIVQLTVTFAIVGTAVGTMTSAFCQKTATSILLAFAIVIAGPGVPGLVYVALEDHYKFPAAWDQVAATTQPLFLWVMGYAKILGGIGFPPSVLDQHTIGSIIVAGLALCLATWRMSREGRVAAGAGKGARRRSRGVFLESPAIDRSVRGSLLHHPRKVAWVTPLLALIALGLHFAAWADDGFDHHADESLMMLGIISLLLGFQILASSGTALAVERKTGALDLLLATPCTTRSLCRGRLLGELAAVAPVIGLATLYGALVCIVDETQPLAVLTWLLSTVLLLAFVAAVGLRGSATARSPGVAAVRGFATLGGIILGHALLLFLLVISDGESIAEWLATGSPPVLVFFLPMATHDGLTSEYGWMFDEEAYIAAWIGLCLYSAAGWWLLRRTGHALRRTLDGE